MPQHLQLCYVKVPFLLYFFSVNTGDIVGLQFSNSDLKDDNIASGVVTKANDNAITVAFDDAVEVSAGEIYSLIKLSNDVTYRRLKE